MRGLNIVAEAATAGDRVPFLFSSKLCDVAASQILHSWILKQVKKVHAHFALDI